MTTNGTPSIAAPATAVSASLTINGIYGPNDSYRSSPAVSYSLNAQPQTVIISPDEATVEVGGFVGFGATGGHNAYEWSVTGGAHNLTADGASAGVEFLAVGSYLVRVKSVAGNGYLESNHATATVNVSQIGIRLKVVNNSTASGVYTGAVEVDTAKQGGYYLGWDIVGPGATVMKNIPKGESAQQLSEVSLFVRTRRVRTDGVRVAEDTHVHGKFTEAQASSAWPIYTITLSNVGVTDPPTNPDENALPTPVPQTPPTNTPEVPAPSDPTKPPALPAPEAPSTPDAPAKPTPTAPLWPPIVVAGSVTTTTSNEIVAAGNAVKTTTTTATDTEGNTSTKTEVSTENTDGSGGGQPAQDLATRYPGVSAGAYDVSGAKPSFTVTMPAKFGGKQFDVDPFRSDRFGGLIAWFRTAVSWLFIVLFGVWASKEVAEWTKATSTIRQAQGNAVAAGTGAQATALVAAAAITVAVGVFLVAILGFAGQNTMTLTRALGVVGVNPTTGLLGGAAWMLDQVFPISVMLLCVVGRMAFNLAAAKLFAVCMTVIRWIVP